MRCMSYAAKYSAPSGCVVSHREDCDSCHCRQIDMLDTINGLGGLKRRTADRKKPPAVMFIVAIAA